MFWDEVTSLMYKNNVSQTQLSLAIGKGKTQVNRWIERGTIPPANYAVKIARYFGTTVEVLVNEPSDLSGESHLSGSKSMNYQDRIQKLVNIARELSNEKIDVLIGVANGFLPSDHSTNNNQNVG